MRGLDRQGSEKSITVSHRHGSAEHSARGPPERSSPERRERSCSRPYDRHDSSRRRECRSSRERSSHERSREYRRSQTPSRSRERSSSCDDNSNLRNLKELNVNTIKRSVNDSTAVDKENVSNNINIQNNEITKDKDEFNEDVVKAIGCRYLGEKQWSAPVCEQIALRWEDIFKKGMPKDDRDIIIKKYTLPINAGFIEPPKLNVDIKESLAMTVRSRDARIIEKQQKITAAVSALASILNESLKSNEINVKLVELASDASSILVDLQHDECNIRKNLILSNLNGDLKETLKDTTPDELLFGKDLQERMKAHEIIARSCKKLKVSSKPYTVPKNSRVPTRWKKPKAMISGGTRSQPLQKIPFSHRSREKMPQRQMNYQRRR